MPLKTTPHLPPKKFMCVVKLMYEFGERVKKEREVVLQRRIEGSRLQLLNMPPSPGSASFAVSDVTVLTI